jgi:hypothetical protein
MSRPGPKFTSCPVLIPRYEVPEVPLQLPTQEVVVQRGPAEVRPDTTYCIVRRRS